MGAVLPRFLRRRRYRGRTAPTVKNQPHRVHPPGENIDSRIGETAVHFDAHPKALDPRLGAPSIGRTAKNLAAGTGATVFVFLAATAEA